MENDNQRLYWIDITKAFAIILVVMGHVVSSYHEAGLYNGSLFYNFLSQFIYSFHMPFFVFVSGLLLSLSNGNKSKTTKIKQTILNYGIPYVVFSVLWIAMKILMSSHTNTQATYKDILLIPIFPVSFMWFIYTLMFMQIIQSLIAKPIIKFKVIHIILSAGGYCIQPLLSSNISWFSDCVISDFLRVYIYFTIGFYFGKWICERLEKFPPITLSICLILILFIGNIIIFKNSSFNNQVVRFALSFIGIAAIITISKQISYNSILQYCGRNTLPIYLLQGFTIAASRLALTKIRFNDKVGVIPMVVCTISGVGISLLVYFISTKIWKLQFFFYPGRYIKLK